MVKYKHNHMLGGAYQAAIVGVCLVKEGIQL